MSRLILVIGLAGGSLFLLSGFLSYLPWAVAGPIAGVLLGSWFGGEVKKRLDRPSTNGRESRVISFNRKDELESGVLEMRTEGWEPQWESYRETHTGVFVRRIIYSVVMERRLGKAERKRFRQLFAPPQVKLRARLSRLKKGEPVVRTE